jgi:L-ascorbate oxidase
MKFSIKLENALGPNPVGGPTEENSFRLCNTTNLHTHGLHESPTAPADTVLVSVDPGESRTYEYTVVPDHMGGTFWYHPHFHGSSALQVCG